MHLREGIVACTRDFPLSLSFIVVTETPSTVAIGLGIIRIEVEKEVNI